MKKKFNHEINFYHQIENTFPFIQKIFGIINQQFGLPIIILEYVEGKTLNDFFKKRIVFNLKIKIIEEILFSVYYIHSNGFFFERFEARKHYYRLKQRCNIDRFRFIKRNVFSK